MDIKELATLTAAEMDDVHLRNVPAIILEQYATRLIAAYLAEQEPDCWAVLTPNGSKLVSPEEAKGLLKAYPLFTAPPEPAPQQQKPQTTIGDSASPAQPAAARAAPSSEEAVRIAHAAGFAGRSWLMGPEELEHVLKVAGLAALVPDGCVVVGYLDGRGRFFYADDPHMEIDHTGMREVFAAGEVK